ncbi:carboxymuconolactone decarboxylase family protein [Fructobacillus ficulneus]|uniref:Carboxymuconolactone decarboxylase n=1 Tax=Fructobacillus ficulneus TaxID=157463 RepID=A0A0K8MIN3_9LACO|nr:carboxymuconolactone decarboxylase family protein [Fructobacillus ficulneus]GAP00318.1 carboxymuconolactone decarboxylase [Fructobacillus ficulneus]
MTEKVTAGRDQLGDFAPQFAALNDDVLFGQVWADQANLGNRDRSLTTVLALMTMGAWDQLPFHLAKAKENGLQKNEAVALITHLAFYVGWPKAWSAFQIAKDVYGDEK